MRRHVRWIEYGVMWVGLVAAYVVAVVAVGELSSGRGTAPGVLQGVAELVAREARGADGDGSGAMLPKPIAGIEEAGGEVISLGENDGLAAFLVIPPSGRAYTAYALESGSVLVGLLLGPGGENLTEAHLRKADEAGKLAVVRARLEGPAGGAVIPVQDREWTVPELFEVTRLAPGFWIGDRGPEFHTFVDPTCPFSVEHVRLLARDAALGKLKAHVIPVGVLGERGVEEAIRIAGSEFRRAKWDGGDGGAFDREAGVARVASNRELHRGWRVRGVPFTVWMGPREVQVYYGAGEASSFAADVMRGS